MLRKGLWMVLAGLAFGVSGPLFAAVPITGQVLVDGEGLAGATISLIPLERRSEEARRLLTAEPDPPPVATAKSGAQGIFEIQAPRPGLWKVRAEADGRLAVEYRLQPLVEPLFLPPVELEPAVTVTLQMRGGEGEPLADARWLARRGRRPGHRGWSSGSDSRGWYPALRFGMSDEKGRIRAATTADEYLVSEVVALQQAPFVRKGELAGKVDLRLERGSPRTVRVVDAEKRPVPGVLVLPGDERFLPLAETDAQGEVSLQVPPEDELSLSFLAADGRFAEAVLTAGKPVGEDTSPVEIVRLRAPTILAGRVIELGNRQPIAGALVAANDAFGDHLTTDAQGAYRLRTHDDQVPIIAGAPGFLPAVEIWKRDAGQSAGPSLALPRGGSLRGQIVDVRGRPIVGADITAEPDDPSRRFFTSFTPESTFRRRSDAQGRFSFATLPASPSWALAVGRSGFAPVELEVENLQVGESRDLRVVMKAGLRVVGWVVDEQERPVRGAEVQLVPSIPAGKVERMPYRSRQPRPAKRPEDLTDQKGRFELADLAAGSHDLEVRAGGFAPATVRGIKVIEAEEAIDLGTVILVSGAEIEGRVVDAQEGPISGAKIQYWEVGGRRSVARRALMGDEALPGVLSGDDGAFVVPDLLPGSQISLFVSKPGFVSGSVPSVAVPSSEEIRLVLRQGARVSGRVVNEDDQPLADARIKLGHDDHGGSGRGFAGPGTIGFTTTDAEGYFVIEEILPGAITLTAVAEGYQENRLSGLQVPVDGDLGGVRLQLERGATVHGVVSDAEGTPVVGVWVQVIESGSRGGSFRGIAVTDGDGRYQILGVPPGRQMVKASIENLREVAVEAEIEKGINEVDLAFRGGVEIGGRVVDAGGEPVSGAAISLRAGRSFWGGGEVTTGPEGSFLIEDVPPGTYEVGASKEGYAPGRLPAPLEIVDQSVHGLELRLGKGSTLHGRILGLDFDELAQVEIHVRSQDNRGRLRGQVDYTGSYRVEHLAAGAWTVVGSVASRQTRDQVVIDPGVAEVEQDLEFTSGYTLSGSYRVDDRPVPGAMIKVAGGGTSASGQATTDQRGRFAVEGLKEGAYQVMVFDWESHIEHNETVELSEDQEIAISIRTGTISGTVEDDLDQSPLKDVVVSTVPIDEGVATEALSSDRGESDSRGYFSLGRLPAGRWKITAHRPGYAPAELEVELAAGQVISDLELSLRPTEGVVFEVVLPSGLPAGEAMAAVVDASGKTVARGRYTTTGEGQVRINDLAPGSFELLVASGASAITRLPIISPGRLGKVQLSPGGRVEIVAPELAEERGATVTLVGPGGRSHQELTGWGLRDTFILQQGRLEVGQLDAGAYTVTVEADDRRWTETVQVTPGASSQVEIR